LCRAPNSTLNQGYGIYAGLGLAWLETQIAGRNCLLTHSRYDWVDRLSKQLSKLELRDLPPMPACFEPLRYQTYQFHGTLHWGWEGMAVHNRFQVVSVSLGPSPEATLLSTNPISTNSRVKRHKFEPRWFKLGVTGKNGAYCALEEWIDPKDRKNCKKRIVVFHSPTGEDVTHKLAKRLSTCSALERLNPVLRS
jgi:hypothetical protein